MLKKKMSDLLQQKSQEDQRGFEVLKDNEAAELLGGVDGCTKLQNCTTTFTGSCGSLYSCGTYSET
jgi:hypothetical protein